MKKLYEYIKILIAFNIFFQDEHNNCKSEKNEIRVNYNNLFS